MRLSGRLLAAIGVAMLLVAGGCGDSSDKSTGTGSGIRLYGTDGNMSNSFGAHFKTTGAIDGMVGTVPLTPLSDDFKQRLRALDPKLTDYNYAGETYDAVVIAALAAQLAHSTEPTKIAKYINGVTQLSPGGVECRRIAECLTAISQGKDIAYRGVTVRDGFTDAGEPATASYGTLHFGRDNQIDNGKTEYVLAGNPTTSGTTPAPQPATNRYRGEPLKLAFLLPQSGPLAFIGPPMFDGGHLAVKEINEAGGILDQQIESTDSDDASTDAAKAGAALTELVARGTSVIIGPASSGETKELIPQAAQKGVVLISPSATSADLSTIDDHGLFFRTCPPDSFQSQALADVIMRGGARRVFIVARDDSYGIGLRDGVTKDLTSAGIQANDIASQTYKDKQDNYQQIITAIEKFKPDAVLVAGYEESAAVIKAIQSAGVTFTAG